MPRGRLIPDPAKENLKNVLTMDWGMGTVGIDSYSYVDKQKKCFLVISLARCFKNLNYEGKIRFCLTTASN